MLSPVIPKNSGSSLARRLRRLAAIVRYHRPPQLARRAAKVVRRRMLGRNGSVFLPAWPDNVPELRDPAPLAVVAQRRVALRGGDEAREVAARFARNRIRLLNVEVDFGQPARWELNGAAACDGEQVQLSHLWRFQFHYHEFLLDLAADSLARGTEDGIEDAWRFVLDWIANHPITELRAHDDAWHPFCISRRLPVWVSLWNLAPPGSADQDMIRRSLWQQAQWLVRNLEWDLGGNHLLENLRGLAVAAAFFAGREADGWMRRVARFLPGQLKEQVLDHGEHFERSPMYHALMLEAVLDLADVLRPHYAGVGELCARTARRMAEFLETILHPDGEIPLLGDSVFGQAPPADRLLAAARLSSGAGHGSSRVPSEDQQTVRCGPYWIWSGHDGDQVLFDAGPVGSDHLPAHAHCDLLNIEVSVGSRRCIVDSGTYGYQDDELRRYCRSTAAHNVVEIDGEDQCDIWSQFRMGRRGRPSSLETGETDGFHWARAAHNGYRSQGVPHVSRWIACKPSGWFIIDSMDGSGTHDLVSRLHLHPDVKAERTGPESVRLALGGRELEISVLGGAQVTVASGWYCPEFGRREACPVLECRVSAVLPVVCGWWISQAESGLAPTDVACLTDRLLVTWQGGRQTVLPFRSGQTARHRLRPGMDQLDFQNSDGAVVPH